MEEKLEELEERQIRMEQKLDMILRLLQPISHSCEGMDQHINFIEGAYSVLRSPIDLTLKAFKPLFGSEETMPDFRTSQLEDN